MSHNQLGKREMKEGRGFDDWAEISRKIQSVLEERPIEQQHDESVTETYSGMTKIGWAL